jgi:hypothetical protein
LGRVPAWIQYPVSYPGYQFTAQINCLMKLPAPVRHSRLVEEQQGNFVFKRINLDHNRSHLIIPSDEDPNVSQMDLYHFGDMRRGYLFVNPCPEHPGGLSSSKTKNPPAHSGLTGFFGVRGSAHYSMMAVTAPAPTVRPPSRIAKRVPSSMAIGEISSTSISTLSPGMHISTPSGSLMTPVTSVVRK